MKLHRNLLRPGFTLVELLVVILIISILLTVGSVALKGAGGKGVTTALATTEALFDEARSVAVSKGARSRVLINIDDPNDPGYLRQIVIVSEVLDAAGQPQDPPSWELASKGYTMPDKVYFSREYSRKNHEAKSGKIDTMELNSTRISATYKGNYLYYEFNSEGICTTGLTGDDYAGPSFVVGAGVRKPGNDTPRTTGEAKRDFAGFVIWRNGSTSVFRNPTQILDGASPTNF